MNDLLDIMEITVDVGSDFREKVLNSSELNAYLDQINEKILFLNYQTHGNGD